MFLKCASIISFDTAPIVIIYRIGAPIFRREIKSESTKGVAPKVFRKTRTNGMVPISANLRPWFLFVPAERKMLLSRNGATRDRSLEKISVNFFKIRPSLLRKSIPPARARAKQRSNGSRNVRDYFRVKIIPDSLHRCRRVPTEGKRARHARCEHTSTVRKAPYTSRIYSWTIDARRSQRQVVRTVRRRSSELWYTRSIREARTHEVTNDR